MERSVQAAFEAWLTEHGFDGYVAVFREQEIDSVAMLLELSDDDFARMGITIGGRRRLLNAARSWSPPASEEHDSERRQLTIMFCDLVGSSAISTTMDPEDLAELLGRYTATCRDAIEANGGHIAKYLGDGILAYFGYPTAHEDDADRAVQSGLDVVREIENLNGRLVGVEPLAVRIGIATGVVVVGDVMHASGGQRDEVVGETPNLAARIQDVASPGEVVVAAPTARLAAGSFEFAELGAFALKGISEPQVLYRADAELGARSRFEARHRPGELTALIGRDEELAVLEGVPARAQAAGRPVLVSIEGEAGIGKSRLAFEFLDRHGGRSRVLQCAELTKTSPFHPFVVHLRRWYGLGEPGATSAETLGRLRTLLGGDELASVELADLLDLDVAAEPTVRAPAQRRATLLQAITTLVQPAAGEGSEQVEVLLVEDVHWADASSVEQLGRLLTTDRPWVVVVTQRSGDDIPWPIDDECHVRIELGPLDADATQLVFASVIATGDASVARELAERSGGIPLFVEELARTATAPIRTGQGGDLAVPLSLHDSLMAQLDSLGSAKHVAQAAAVLGREFTPDLIARVLGVPNADLEPRLEPLLATRILVRDAAGLVFRHALIQDLAYSSMVRTTRRELHKRVAAVLEGDAFPTQPEVIAHHYRRGGLDTHAARAWVEAGEAAARRGASVEAVSHLDAALETLVDVPSSPERDSLELRLQLQRGGMLKVTDGFGADTTGEAFDRASHLARRLDDDTSLAPALLGQYAYWLQHDYLLAGRAAHELREVAQRHGLDAELMIGHRSVAIVDYHVGRIVAGVEGLRRAGDLYDEERHADLRHLHGTDHATTTACFLGMALVLNGRIGEGVELSRSSVEHADRLAHGPSIAQALTYLGFVGAILRDRRLIDEATPRLLEIARRIAFPLMLASGEFWESAGRAFDVPTLEDAEAMIDAHERWIATGNHGYVPFRERVIAEILVSCGDRSGARSRLVAAATASTQTNERFSDAEGHRVDAVVSADEGSPVDEVLGSIHAGIRLARDQGAGLYELRLATTGVDLARRCGATADADRLRRQVAALLDDLDDGTDYPDMVAARSVV